MARSHHRKKHKAHLRQYQHSQEGVTKIKKGKVTGIFTTLGIALGIAIGFFAEGNTIAYIIAAVIGGAVGYFIGKRIDEPANA